ncbi:hypothetical protein RJ639_020851 [Escallonia herrerae]|uniref:Uncharacterized protein n=1 Tax=Escallonia herrerae TaxID=1293975 RepID=A0AA88V3N2_9ASTE|nr:hypothetical protein RJ639_020851 [Escallonia herrerae]
MGKEPEEAMDMDFWAARFHSAKHLSAVQAAAHVNSSGNHVIMEGDDDMRAWFPCPFCFVEIEVPALCSHLQAEHCFNLSTVCPICAENLGKDAIDHFTTQHAHSVKRKRKLQKSGFLTKNSSMMLGKDLSSFLGCNSTNSGGHVPDPLSPFLCNITLSEQPKDNLEDPLPDYATSTTSDTKRSEPKPSISDEAQEEEYAERRQRAAFCQQLILSTIF